MKNFILKILYAILRCEAKTILALHKPEIIAITGSVGKTSTKDAIAHILRDKYDLYASRGNLNTEIGTPLAIMGYPETPSKIGYLNVIIFGVFKNLFSYPKILILEMGADKPGDIKYLTSFIKPKVAIVTSVGPTHLEFFGSIDKIASEKSELIKSLAKDGYAVLNKKDSRVAEMAKLTQAEIKYFSAEPMDIYQQASIKVGEIYGISKEASEKKLKSFKMPKGRMNVIKKKNLTIIDDSYNSNPLAARAALQELAKMKGRKVAILGDMLEQGDYTEKAHKEIGELAGEICDQIMFVGEHANLFEKGAKNKLDSKYIKKSKDSLEAAREVLSIIKPGDIILVKGSRGVGLEKVVEELASSEERGASSEKL